MLKYKNQLNDRAQVKLGMHHWIELDNSPNDNYLNQFKEPKIIYPEITKFLPFSFDNEGYCFNNKVYMMTGNHLEYLVSFLNSKTFKIAFSDFFPELQGNSKELRKVIFQEIPVKLPTEEEEKTFIALVNEILAAKKADAKADTSAAEAEIDRLVYKLYDLTEKEISIIESEG